MTTCPNRIKVAERLGKDLVTRPSADMLFAEMKAAGTASMIIDFDGVESITRSFAHQYMLDRDASDVEVFEVNIPLCIEKMFDVVKNPVRRSSAAMQPMKIIML